MNKSIITFALLSAFTSAVFAQNTFTLSSDNLGGEATVTEEFNGFGCSGENQSPQLSWENAPEGTKSFAVTMYDPTLQQEAVGGIGWFSIFQTTQHNWLLVPEILNLASHPKELFKV